MQLLTPQHPAGQLEYDYVKTIDFDTLILRVSATSCITKEFATL